MPLSGRFVLALIAAAGMQLLGVRLWSGFSEAFDPFLVVAVWIALRGSVTTGMLGGVATGLCRDTLSGVPFGLHGLANTAVAYGAARLSERLLVQHRWTLVAVYGGAAIAQLAALLVGLAIVHPDPQLPAPRALALRVALVALAGGAVALVESRGQAWRERRRRERRSRRRVTLTGRPRGRR